MAFYIFHTHRVCLVECGFNLQPVQLVRRFWVFFLSRIAPGFQFWFYSHLCMGVVHWGLLLSLPWGAWIAPVRARGGGGAAAWVAGVLAAPGPQGGWRLGQQEMQCSRRYGSQCWPLHSSIPTWRTTLTGKPGRPQSTGSQRVGHD